MKSLNTLMRVGLVIALAGMVMGYFAALTPIPQDLSQRYDRAMAQIFLQFMTLGGATLGVLGGVVAAWRKRNSALTKCPRCGHTENNRSDRFCRHCGAVLGKASGAAA